MTFGTARVLSEYYNVFTAHVLWGMEELLSDIALFGLITVQDYELYQY